ncbi:MAG: Mur ligase family protein, partial [Vibrio sp.]
LLCALASLLNLGLSLDALAQTAPSLKPVIGRMELFLPAISQANAKLVVDYAHTPDALEKALQALRIHCQGQLWCIFGCGGDRDAGKRPMMTASAQTYADRLIITDDNPRSEDPANIVKDMLAQVAHPETIDVIHDRYTACEFALKQAGPDDIILIAGKGHEDYQIIGDQRLDYSDRTTAQTLLGI